jgi:catechol 2,3-dioxygenase-like lactoylglutathione lyase family enzyme
MTDFTPRRDVQAISHVNVVVDDIEAATEFYRTVLGFGQAANADGPMDYKVVFHPRPRCLDHYRSSSADDDRPCTRCQLQVAVRPLSPRPCGPGSYKTKSCHDRFV